MGDAKQPASTQIRSSQSLNLVKPKRSESLKPIRTLHVHCCCRLTPHIVLSVWFMLFPLFPLCSSVRSQLLLLFLTVFLLPVLCVPDPGSVGAFFLWKKEFFSPQSPPSHSQGSSACWSFVSKIVTSSPYRYSPASFCRIISYLLFVQTSSTAFCFPHWLPPGSIKSLKGRWLNLTLKTSSQGCW